MSRWRRISNFDMADSIWLRTVWMLTCRASAMSRADAPSARINTVRASCGDRIAHVDQRPGFQAVGVTAANIPAEREHAALFLEENAPRRREYPLGA
jgi:hypothetical protein